MPGNAWMQKSPAQQAPKPPLQGPLCWEHAAALAAWIDPRKRQVPTTMDKVLKRIVRDTRVGWICCKLGVRRPLLYPKLTLALR
jgi:hypothetical protein